MCLQVKFKNYIQGQAITGSVNVSETVDIPMAQEAINLCRRCEEWFGSTEDGGWAELVPIVKSIITYHGSFIQEYELVNKK